MILVQQLSKGYAGDLLLDQASFVINPGERCGLVGRNGSGKSTLLRIITGEVSADSGGIEIPKGYRLGYLRQQIQMTEPTLLEEAAMGLPEEERYMTYKAEKILFGLGFTKRDMDRHPSEFSGGFALRVHLTKVLLGDPDCLLLDEPTNYLDIVSIGWLTRFLTSWRRELLVISHDRDFMDAVTTHTLGIHRHKVRKYEGNTSAYYEGLFAEEELHERSRVKVEKKKEHAEEFIRRFGAKATKAGQAQSRAKMIARLPSLEKLVKLEQLQFRFRETPFPSRKMAALNQITFSYPDMPDLEPGENLIEGVSLEIEKGERIGVIGKNGRGKSTLLRLLIGELEPNGGEALLSPNTKVGYFGQTHIDRLDGSKTIEKEIGEANPQLSYGEIRAICGAMLFSGDRAKKPISVLSGGERSRVLLGKILATPCNLLVLDEPTNHLDMESIEALMEALERFSGSIILVTHSELILDRVATKLIVCHRGAQHTYLGTYSEFLEAEGWGEEDGEPAKAKKSPPPKEKSSGQRLKRLEEEINVLEREIAELEEELLKVGQQGDHRKSRQLTEQVEAKRRDLDGLFEQIGS